MAGPCGVPLVQCHSVQADRRCRGAVGWLIILGNRRCIQVRSAALIHLEPGKSRIRGVLRTLYKQAKLQGIDRWLAEPYQCRQGGRVARRCKWRKIRDGDPVPQGWRDLNGETGQAMANPDPDANDPRLYPVVVEDYNGVHVDSGDLGCCAWNHALLAPYPTWLRVLRQQTPAHMVRDGPPTTSWFIAHLQDNSLLTVK